jgi:integrase
LTKAGKTGADLLAFLILTGCRFNEAAKLTWDRVDLEAGTWYLPDPKNRNAVTFPLSNQAKEILENRPRGNEFVFTGRLNGHFKDLRDTLLKFEKEIGIRITAHDLRRTFTAIAGECGLELWKVKLLMNHKLHGDVTLNNYTERHDLKYLQPEADKIGKWIEQQAIIFDAENVINLDAKRRQKA